MVSSIASNGVAPTPAPTAATTGFMQLPSKGAVNGPSMSTFGKRAPRFGLTVKPRCSGVLACSSCGARALTAGPIICDLGATSSTNAEVQSPTDSMIKETQSDCSPEQMVNACHSCEICGTHNLAYIPALQVLHRSAAGRTKSSRNRALLVYVGFAPGRRRIANTVVGHHRASTLRIKSKIHGSTATAKGTMRGTPMPSQLLDPCRNRKIGHNTANT
mmetsp:Transcript_15674/g.37773  ORF Transcript_15674/g.37773 Transcript_15674/m.37773 type:complete len:217 (-) Transcript_15674:1062-1712(-)